MAISTLDGALAGMRPPDFYAKAVSGTLVAGRPFTPNYLAGIPGAMTAPAITAAGLALTSYAGQIPIPAASGNTHLARFSGVSSAQGGLLMLCDRLWHNSGLDRTSATAQTVNSAAWPARDSSGTTNGEQVFIGIEVSVAMGTGVPTISYSYTNQAGTASKTGANIDAVVASSAAGTFLRLGLAAGDTGVRSIQTITNSATWGTSGAYHLVAYRVLATLELGAAGLPNAVDALTSGMPRLYDTSVPFLIFVPQTTTTTQLTGSVVYTQG